MQWTSCQVQIKQPGSNKIRWVGKGMCGCMRGATQDKKSGHMCTRVMDAAWGEGQHELGRVQMSVTSQEICGGMVC